jgi:hypothetical protein
VVNSSPSVVLTHPPSAAQSGSSAQAAFERGDGQRRVRRDPARQFEGGGEQPVVLDDPADEADRASTPRRARRRDT